MSLRSLVDKAKESLKKKLFPAGLPSWRQWKQILQVLTKREKRQLIILVLLFFGSAVFLGINFYYDHTELVPAPGGEYIEGVIGQPRFINPIYGVLNDVDRDLVQLLFSGLMDYDENGRLIPSLAKEFPTVLGDGKVFEVNLRENLFWSDGTKLTADDIVFTVKIIQDPDYKSPLRANWIGVEAKKISDSAVRFTLASPYTSFLENLTIKILPYHIWQDISSQNFPLSPYNLSPVSLGPYQIKKLEQDKEGSIRSLTLTINTNYYKKNPYLNEITFRFFDNDKDLIKASREKEIQGLSISNPKDYETVEKFGFQDYHFSVPRYFAVFFNPLKSETLAENQIRKALNYATNREEIIKQALLGEGKIVQSPILPEIYGFSSPTTSYEFKPETAKEILEKAGFIMNEAGIREKTIKEESTFQLKSDLKLGSQGQEVRDLQTCLADPTVGGTEVYPEAKITGFFGPETKNAVIQFQEKYAKDILEPQGLKKGTGTVSKATRTKLNELCGKKPDKILSFSFSLTTVNQPLLIEIANILKNQWQSLGANVEIKTIDIETLERDVIKPRNYEALLFGEVLGAIPDPFPFWHSSQKKDPGLNLAMYEDKQTDKLLEEARETLDFSVAKAKLEEFQNSLIESSPVVFLYSPDYVYLVRKEVKGIKTKMITDPSKRFSGIENWYLKTKRKWQ